MPAPGTYHSPWQADDGFQLGGERTAARDVLVDGTAMRIEISWGPSGAVVGGEGMAEPVGTPGRSHVTVADGKVYVLHDLSQTVLAWPAHDLDLAAGDDGGHSIRAPINGRVAKLFVRAGEAIERGARVGILEAMKMEHVLHASRAGVVVRLTVTEGQQVQQGTVVVELAAGEKA
jgi:3-methylcrotonyl-CoA carboxylase alpha subunit